MSTDGRNERVTEPSAGAQAGDAPHESGMPDQASNPARRELLKALGIAGGVLAVHALMPRDWCPPLVELTRLPAHAQTSGASCTKAQLTTSRAKDGKVTLSWTGITGKIAVYRKAADETVQRLVGSVDPDINTFLDVTTDAQTTYDYRVVGNCSAIGSVGKAT